MPDTMPAKPPIKIAIIGFSSQVGKRYTQHVLENSETDLIALVDAAPGGTAVKAALDVGTDTPLFTSTTLLIKSLGDQKPDAAIVCTPPKTHVRIATELVEAGIHVFVEKPIGNEIESARALTTLAQRKGVNLLVGHHRRFNAYIAATKRIIDAGLLGDIMAVSAL